MCVLNFFFTWFPGQCSILLPVLRWTAPQKVAKTVLRSKRSKFRFYSPGSSILRSVPGNSWRRLHCWLRLPAHFVGQLTNSWEEYFRGSPKCLRILSSNTDKVHNTADQIAWMLGNNMQTVPFIIKMYRISTFHQLCSIMKAPCTWRLLFYFSDIDQYYVLKNPHHVSVTLF